MYKQTALITSAAFIFGVILLVFVPGISSLWGIAVIPIISASVFIFFGLSIENLAGLLIASFFLEAFSGLPVGAYPASIAISAFVLMLAGNIIRLEPLISLPQIGMAQVISGLGVAYILCTVILLVSYPIMSLAYGYGGSLTTTIREFFSPRIFIETILSILLTWLCWRGIQQVVSLRRNKW